MSTARSDETRHRLLEAAAAVFAEKGFHKASVRAIAEAAGTNLALIHYHFGDKAGLYRAIFAEHFRVRGNELQSFVGQTPKFSEVYSTLILSSLRNISDNVRRMARREEIEPTGLIGHNWIERIRHTHQILVEAACREIGIAEPDRAIHELVVTIAGMAFVFGHHRHMLRLVVPELVDGHDWLERTVNRLTRQAIVLLHAERDARQASSPAS